MQLEPALHERVAQIQFEQAARLRVGIHLWLEEAKPAPSIGLGAVHGKVGAFHELLGIRIAVQSDGNADACPNDNLVTFDREGDAEHVDQTLRQECGVVRLLLGDLKDCELVAAETGNPVRVLHALAQPLGDSLEQRISDRMPEGVVDALEAV
jgi:hypothetical protein